MILNLKRYLSLLLVLMLLIGIVPTAYAAEQGPAGGNGLRRGGNIGADRSHRADRPAGGWECRRYGFGGPRRRKPVG